MSLIILSVISFIIILVFIAIYRNSKNGVIVSKKFALKLAEDYIEDRKFYKSIEYISYDKRPLFIIKKIGYDDYIIDISTDDNWIRDVLRDRLKIEKDSTIISAERYKSIVEYSADLFGSLRDSIRIKWIIDTDRMRTG